MANSFDVTTDLGVYRADWEARLQARLDKPQNWMDICDVIFTNARYHSIPYMNTEFSASAGTRGTAYTFSDFALTNEAIDVSTMYIAPVFVDRADLAQIQYVTAMELADRQASLLNEQVETAVLADHAAWTDVGDNGGVVTSANTTAFTVTATNIDDIVRGVRRIITAANGEALAKQNGIFFVWRPADFEALEQFAQANGFNLADAALKNGIDRGYYLMGAYHYVSNSHTAGHVFAGVRKIHKVGILRATYGNLQIVDEPADPAGALSGVGMTARIDYGVKTPTGLKPLLYDINVA
jgi:hypothetical protein